MMRSKYLSKVHEDRNEGLKLENDSIQSGTAYNELQYIWKLGIKYDTIHLSLNTTT